VPGHLVSSAASFGSTDELLNKAKDEARDRARRDQRHRTHRERTKAWSIADYLASLKKHVDELLEEQSKPEVKEESQSTSESRPDESSPEAKSGRNPTAPEVVQ
jgi:hypothetical protein